MTDIFNKTKHIDPEYAYLITYAEKIWKGFWTPAKYQKNIKRIDAPHVVNKMSRADAEAVKRCVVAISLVEDKVKTFWSNLHSDIPQTVVGEVGGTFGNSEVVHSLSYRALGESLGITDMFDKVMSNPVIKGRVDYLQKYLDNKEFRGKKRVLKKLVLFTALVERASLFSQFYILMSYAARNKGLKTISSLQSSTMVEELLHYRFGVELINIIKTQHPKLWDEALVALVSKDLKAAYDSEINLIDWIFEEGTPEHITKEEVINFINYNFSIIARDLEIPVNFSYNSELYETKNSWLSKAISAPGEPDFFASPVGGYSAVQVELGDEDIDDIFED